MDYKNTLEALNKEDRGDLYFWIQVADALGLVVRGWTYRHRASIGTETGSIVYEITEDLGNRILGRNQV